MTTRHQLFIYSAIGRIACSVVATFRRSLSAREAAAVDSKLLHTRLPSFAEHDYHFEFLMYLWLKGGGMKTDQSVKNKEAILNTLSENKQALMRFGVKEIGLFGSYVRDQAHSDSDIDLLVDIEKTHKTFRNFLALTYYLEDLLGTKVDLVTKQSLSPYIGPHILNTVSYASLSN